MDDAVWDATVFTKNRLRLLQARSQTHSSRVCWSRYATSALDNLARETLNKFSAIHWC